MRLKYVSLIAVIALSISAVGQANVRAGSYSFTATGGSGVSLVNYDPQTQSWTSSPVPSPTSIVISMNYDPTQGYDYIQGSSGDATTFVVYNSQPFSFRITGTGSPNWPGFFAVYAQSMTVTAPQPGGGLDTISFTGSRGPDNNFGGFSISAPNGTLSTSTELPDSLAAFQDYAANHPDVGNFSFDASFAQGSPPFLEGNAYGLVGAAVPEPTTLCLLSISISLVVGAAALRKRTSNSIADRSRVGMPTYRACHTPLPVRIAKCVRA
jgi:hypothetical protein